jgi:GrpB-like predicted nucleotidyltransferase (UPF0157 family)
MLADQFVVRPVDSRDSATIALSGFFLREPPGYRRVNVHVRVVGQANQRYPLLFRDYLRAHPASARAYATLKKDLALLLPDDLDHYTDVKDAACDLIYFAAEAWAQTIGWNPGPSDG